MSIETMTKLATTTLSTSTASVTFSNIPQGYTDLKISVSGRTTGGVGDSSELGTISFSFGSTSYTYSDRFIGGNGTAAYSSANSVVATSVPIYWLNGSGSTANTFASVNIDIPNYTSNNAKNISYEATPEYNNTTLRMIAGGILTTKTDPVTEIILTAGQTAFATHSTFTLYGVKAMRTAVGNSIKATGGNISFDGTYVYHVFNSTAAFVPSQPLTADVLVVAGGGGAGSYFGAGGGGGGVLEFALQSLSGGNSYTCTVGAGATKVTTNIPGNNGSNSQFGSLTETVGGGGGGGGVSGGNGKNGGSGGGGGQTGTAGLGTTNQGNNGYTFSTSQTAGGGGGAGAAATNANGGNGRTSDLINSIGSATGAGETVSGNTYFAGGGGGAPGPAAYGTGGFGGGGSTASGRPNTGGGGGSDQAAGGSGIVVIRYKG